MNISNVLGFIIFAILLCGGLEGSCSDDIAVPYVELNPLLCYIDGVAIPCVELNHLCSLLHRYWDLQDLHSFLANPPQNPSDFFYMSNLELYIFSEYSTLKAEILSICANYNLDVDACYKHAFSEYSKLYPDFDLHLYKDDKG